MITSAEVDRELNRRTGARQLLQHSVREMPEGVANEEFVMTFHLHKEVI